MSSESSVIFFGLSSAACWGAGDFSGGVATKRSNVYTVVIISQLIGITFLTGLALLLPEQFPSPVDMLWGGIAGISGGIGLVALYRGLARGYMGVVAPVSAIVTAIVPLSVGLSLEGLPAIQKLAGFGIGLIAVWLVSRAGDEMKIQLRDLGLPVLAGLGFGFFQVFIDRTSDGAILWPLVAVRITSLTMIFVVTLTTKQVQIPEAKQLPVMALAGLGDTGGNAFFVLAAHTGRLDMAAVLAALYPAGTVLLAWLILKEKIDRQQWLGIIAALAAIVLIAL